MPDGKVISRGKLFAGTGFYLDQLAERDVEAHQAFVRRSFEAILRLIEVRRQRVLAEVNGAVGQDDAWMEMHDVAIALCRQTRRIGDVRFLNTACKLTDWAFPTHRKLDSGDRLARYLLALAERELAIKVTLS